MKVATEKIKAVEFEIGFSECSALRPGRSTSWDQVNSKLNTAMHRLPPGYLGCAKTDVTTRFADGFEWQSRIDLTPGERVDLAQHMADFLMTYSGRKMPGHWSDRYGDQAEKKYRQFLSQYSPEDLAELCRVLDTYDLGD